MSEHSLSSWLRWLTGTTDSGQEEGRPLDRSLLMQPPLSQRLRDLMNNSDDSADAAGRSETEPSLDRMRIAAYLDGMMEVRERAEFERELVHSTEMRAELMSSMEWLEAIDAAPELAPEHLIEQAIALEGTPRSIQSQSGWFRATLTTVMGTLTPQRRWGIATSAVAGAFVLVIGVSFAWKHLIQDLPTEKPIFADVNDYFGVNSPETKAPTVLRSPHTLPEFPAELPDLARQLVEGQLDEAETLNKKVIALYQAGKYADATELAEREVAIREKALGFEHPDVAASLNNLAELYRVQGSYAEAEPLYTRALAIREKALGPAHPDVAQSLNELAGLYRAQGRNADAELLQKRTQAIDKRKGQ
jgi:tetratricopeptide (TPR) repeat protein